MGILNVKCNLLVFVMDFLGPFFSSKNSFLQFLASDLFDSRSIIANTPDNHL